MEGASDRILCSLFPLRGFGNEAAEVCSGWRLLASWVLGFELLGVWESSLLWPVGYQELGLPVAGASVEYCILLP